MTTDFPKSQLPSGSLPYDRYGIILTFTEQVLGGSPLSEDIYAEWIASKAPDGAPIEQELESIARAHEAATSNGDNDDEMVLALPATTATTGFHRLPDGQPCLMDWHIKGMLKELGKRARRVDGSRLAKIPAYKQVIQDLVYAEQRQIPLLRPEGEPIPESPQKLEVYSRPLRAETPQGPRTAIASSETLPAGTRVVFTLRIYKSKKFGIADVMELLDFLPIGGGIGQWRNGGFGRCTAEVVPLPPV